MILQDWWYTTLLGMSEPIEPPLRGEVKTDVLIVGGGAAGLAAALRFIGTDKKVVLLERNICGGSSTGKSAGFLTPDSELELSQLLRRYGEKGARDLWAAPVRGVEIMTSVIRKHAIECDLVRQDSLFLGKGRGGWDDIQEEADARGKLGYPYKLYHGNELPAVLGSTDYSGAIRYSDTYGVNALRYAQGVKRVLKENGVAIYESSEVIGLKDHTANTHLGSVTADQIIFCADKLKPQVSKYAWNVYHAQTFLSISEPLASEDVRAMFPEEPFQCWDTDLTYTYFRLTGTRRLLVGGGSLWSTYAKNDTTTEHIIEHVIHGLREKFPGLKDIEFIQYWPGRIDMTRDLLPTVLRDPDAPWIHYVLGSVGLPWATFCGDFVAERVLEGRQSADHKYYRYFSIDRGFLVPLWLERIMGKRLVFTANNAWAKYRQVDRGKTIPYEEGNW